MGFGNLWMPELNVLLPFPSKTGPFFSVCYLSKWQYGHYLLSMPENWTSPYTWAPWTYCQSNSLPSFQALCIRKTLASSGSKFLFYWVSWSIRTISFPQGFILKILKCTEKLKEEFSGHVCLFGLLMFCHVCVLSPFFWAIWKSSTGIMTLTPKYFSRYHPPKSSLM